MNFDLTGLTRSLVLVFSSLSLILAAVGCDQKPGKKQEPSTPQAPAESPDSVKPPSAGTNPPGSDPADQAKSAEPAITATGDGDLVGRVSRQMIVEQREDWKESLEEASPDEKDARALATVKPGAEVTVYFGAWCDDCQRELPRFLKAVDIAGDVPFTYELIGVDKYFRADEASVDPMDIPAVPYFVVERNGQVVGTVVEQPTETIERDLLLLLQEEPQKEE
jgi:hypothetical protein